MQMTEYSTITASTLYTRPTAVQTWTVRVNNAQDTQQ